MINFKKLFDDFSRQHFKKSYQVSDIVTILKLALPAMAENVLQVLLGIVDTFFIARIGTEAIAGVGATNLVMNIYIAFFTALGVGTTAIVANKIGAKKVGEADHAAEQSLVLSLLIGLVTGILTLFFARNILQLLGLESTVISLILPYFNIVAVPSVLLAVMLTMSSALRGAGDTRTPMKVTLVINIINVVLDYFLIFGVFNFKGLGVTGAGMATTISRFTGVILIILALQREKVPLNINLNIKRLFDPIMIKTILAIGSPAALEKLVMRSGQLFYSSLIIKIGTEAYAAHNIAGSIESFSYMPGYGFAIAASTLIGQNLGAEKPERAENLGVLSNILGTIFMVIVGMVFFVFARPLVGLFTNEETVLGQAVNALKIIALVQPALCITLVITAGLQGAGDTKFPMYSTLIGIWGFRVTGVYFLGIVLKLGLTGVWLAIAADLIIRGVLLLYRFKNGKWKKKMKSRMKLKEKTHPL